MPLNSQQFWNTIMSMFHQHVGENHRNINAILGRLSLLRTKCTRFEMCFIDALNRDES
ncbi:hypothetical protein HanRHA438_Chr01g0033861 [Helianthus annuus]|nr:hypothetical protein HanRHA438_Chr01g0033861 [Helianthus annuus]